MIHGENISKFSMKAESLIYTSAQCLGDFIGFEEKLAIMSA